MFFMFFLQALAEAVYVLVVVTDWLQTACDFAVFTSDCSLPCLEHTYAHTQATFVENWPNNITAITADGLLILSAG